MTARDSLTLFFAGDVMTGRGIDQALPHPSDPKIHERFVRDAREYVQLAERRNGVIGAPLDAHEPWGAALGAWADRKPDLRVVNLETSVTTSDDAWPGKGIHYRMHPQNVGCLTAAGLDCCTLANNHVLDWGYTGLEETLATLAHAGIATCGAGADIEAASAPATLTDSHDRKVHVFSVADASSGVPDTWAARPERAGVHRIDLSRGDEAERFARLVAAHRGAGDTVVVSVHWGGNWDASIPEAQRRFAHTLIDAGAADIVHGHSSHHVKAVECYRGRFVLYGCGDFLTDYEGIGGHRGFRPWIAPAWLATANRSTGRFEHVDVLPLTVKRFRLGPASKRDLRWVGDTLEKRADEFGVRIERRASDLRIRCMGTRQ